MAEPYFNSADLLSRCRDTIEVTFKQQLQNEIEISKQIKKENDYKLKQSEIQNSDLRNIVNVLTSDLEKLRNENEFLKIDNSKQVQIISENNSLLREINEIKKENQRLTLEALENEKKRREELKEKDEILKVLNQKNEEIQNISKNCAGIENKLGEILKEKTENFNKNLENERKVNEKELECQILRLKLSELEKDLVNKTESFELAKKKLAAGVKNELKLKFKEKEEKLKKDIGLSIEEIQKTIKSNSVEQAKLKKANTDLQKTLEIMQSRNRNSGIDIESVVKMNNFLKEKIEITENALKSEIDKNNKIVKESENDLARMKTLNSELNTKLSQKSSKIQDLTKQLSEIDKKTEEILQKFLEKESNYRKKLTKSKEKYKFNTTKLLKSIEELQILIKEKELESNTFKETIKSTKKDLDQALADKKALEKSITELEISLKQLDIQQARQSLEELASVKHKLAQEAGNKVEIEEKIQELQQECEFIQKKIIQDSHFFKVENARKDQEILKLTNFYESKVKQKDAERAIKLEEIRADLSGVLEELINNEACHDCCSIIEQIIEGLA